MSMPGPRREYAPVNGPGIEHSESDLEAGTLPNETVPNDVGVRNGAKLTYDLGGFFDQQQLITDDLHRMKGVMSRLERMNEESKVVTLATAVGVSHSMSLLFLYFRQIGGSPATSRTSEWRGIQALGAAADTIPTDILILCVGEYEPIKKVPRKTNCLNPDLNLKPNLNPNLNLNLNLDLDLISAESAAASEGGS